MRRKRFTLLAAVLVALNLSLWVVPQGLALSRSVVSQLFGPKLIRAEVVDSCGSGCKTDTRIDRGIITQVSALQITLKEADGAPQTIPLSGATKITGAGKGLKTGWRVLVIWQANGSAQSVQVEAKGSGKGRSGALGTGRGRAAAGG